MGTMFNTALKLAVQYHEGQVDKSGEDYILHILAVILKCNTEDERTVAALHDIVEDTEMSLIFLRSFFPEHIVDAVEAITFRKGFKTREQYYERILRNPLALTVKKADLEHNMQRLPRLKGTPDYDRLSEKYVKAYTALNKGDAT